MGIRVEAFVVDVVLFDRLLDRPLWRILADMRKMPPSEDFFSVGLSPSTRFHVTPDRRVVRSGSHQSTRSLSDEELAATEDLQCSMRQYLAACGCPVALMWLMRFLPTLDGARYAHQITADYRRWWIGSLLAAAADAWQNTLPLHELAGYLARILRGFDCGYPLEPHNVDPESDTFPVIPHDQADTRMAVLTEAECLRFVELLQLLLQCGPVFGRPPLAKKHSDDDVDWDEWVRRMIGHFLRIPELALPNMRLVTFIG